MMSNSAAAPPSEVNVSPFALQEMFPDAQGIFSARYESLEEIKDDFFVVLDANVLLLPYKMELFSLNDVIEVYKPLAEKANLVIPAQAAREFAKHRSAKVGEIVQYLKAQAGLSGPDLKKKVGALAGQADYEAAKDLVAATAENIKTLQAAINKLAERIAADVGEDPVSVAYRTVFGSAVSDDPIPQDGQKEFGDELKQRYAIRRPPGFKDQSKPDGGGGDLLIWKTILMEGTRRRKPCIFITADEKADWYGQFNGAFQPRLELLEEFRAAAGTTIHILPLSRFLRWKKVRNAAVADVQRAEAENLIPELAKRLQILESDIERRARAADEASASAAKRQAYFDMQLVEMEIQSIDRAIVGSYIVPPADLSQLNHDEVMEWEKIKSQVDNEVAQLVERKQALYHKLQSLR